VSLVFWAWVTTAVILLLGEAVTTGLFVAPWASGAAVAAVLEALHVGMNAQWIAFIVVSSIVLVVIQRMGIGRK
jgi:membrane protein implicated in regulation of membrane protease activity